MKKFFSIRSEECLVGMKGKRWCIASIMDNSKLKKYHTSVLVFFLSHNSVSGFSSRLAIESGKINLQSHSNTATC